MITTSGHKTQHLHLSPHWPQLKAVPFAECVGELGVQLPNLLPPVCIAPCPGPINSAQNMSSFCPWTVVWYALCLCHTPNSTKSPKVGELTPLTNIIKK